MLNYDYDLKSAIHYNQLDNFNKDDILNVLAVWEGQNDGDSWRWIVELNNGKFAYLIGWCDYTGWDCQSGLDDLLADSAEQAANFEENFTVRDDLLSQLVNGKIETWVEQTNKELGVQK